jgi:Ca2+-binding EF-hand superfamily protein
MKRFFTVLSVLIWIAGFGSVVAAAERQPMMKESAVSVFDMNKDGVVTLEEFRAYWRGNFKELDTDKDGKVTAEEFTSGMKQAFGRMDANKDNVLVVQEMVVYYCGADAKAPEKDARKGRKMKIDADRDKKISKDECVVFWSAHFNDMDTDKDRKVTMEEFLAGMKDRFRKYDQNGDGYITIEEIDVYWAQQPAKAGKKETK